MQKCGIKQLLQYQFPNRRADVTQSWRDQRVHAQVHDEGNAVDGDSHTPENHLCCPSDQLTKRQGGGTSM